jgi:SAM-dependent methyltransferase
MSVPKMALANSAHPALTQSRSSATSLDVRRYWDMRLAAAPGLKGVGYLRLGRAYNEWMYRVRTDVFRRLLHNWNLSGRALHVLDVGSGTGHYIREWLRSGAARVVGSDFSETALQRLRAEFPGVPIRRLDIGTSELPASLGRYDVVSAFDVLFHIIDDDAYRRAIRNCFHCCRPGGYFVFSELFLRHRAGVPHMVSRSSAEIADVLRCAGFVVLDRVPMFVLMNYPADAGALLKLAWSAMVAPATLSEWAGEFLGRVLTPIERCLVRAVRESPTTEIMLCRRPGCPRRRTRRMLRSRVDEAMWTSSNRTPDAV